MFHITIGGTYNRLVAAFNVTYIIDTSEFVRIVGPGSLGGDIFAVLPLFNSSLQIEQFNKFNDKFNFTEHTNIHSMSNLAITSGSVIITFPTTGQKIRIVNLTPADMSESNFIFTPQLLSSEGNQMSKERQTIIIVASNIIGALILILFLQLLLKWRRLYLQKGTVIHKEFLIQYDMNASGELSATFSEQFEADNTGQSSKNGSVFSSTSSQGSQPSTGTTDLVLQQILLASAGEVEQLITKENDTNLTENYTTPLVPISYSVSMPPHSMSFSSKQSLSSILSDFSISDCGDFSDTRSEISSGDDKSVTNPSLMEISTHNTKFYTELVSEQEEECSDSTNSSYSHSTGQGSSIDSLASLSLDSDITAED